MPGDGHEVCDTCGQRHVATVRPGPGTGHVGAEQGEAREVPSCTGHVRYDRSTYVKGQAREKLPEPRPCRRPRPTDGGDRWSCRWHGGSAPHIVANRERRVIEQRAQTLAARWAVPVDTTPTEAILGRVSAFAGHVKFYAEKVAELDDTDLVWGVTKEIDGHVVVGNGPDAYVDANTDQVREAKPNVWLVLYNEASEKLVRFAAEALKAGIEERRVRLAESQGALVADVLRAVAARLNLTPEQTALFATVAPEELRKLASVA